MLYPYQDEETLCVTLEDPGKEAISEFALRAIVVFPLFPAALATLFSFLFTLLSASDLKAPLFQPHAYLALATLPFLCAGFAALAFLMYPMHFVFDYLPLLFK